MSSFRNWFAVPSRVNNRFFNLHINFEVLPNDLNGIGFVLVLNFRLDPIFLKWNNLIVLLIQVFFKHRIVLWYFVSQRICFWWDISSYILGLSITTRLHWRELEMNTIKLIMILNIFLLFILSCLLIFVLQNNEIPFPLIWPLIIYL